MDFSKVGLIVGREYFTRVKKKTFLISTILTPLSILAIMMISAYFSSGALNNQQEILVLDKSGVFVDKLKDNPKVKYSYGDAQSEALRESFLDDGYSALLEIPNFDRTIVIKELPVKYTSDSKPGLVSIAQYEDRIADVLEAHNIQVSGYDAKALKELSPDVNLQANVTGEESTDEVSTVGLVVGSALGGAMGFIMYMVLIIYGSFVMRSVMEEKINRIVEVVISSVKPFELMLGKILGVGAVGLTQLVVWCILLGVGYAVMGVFFASSIDIDPTQAQEAMKELSDVGVKADIQEVLVELGGLNWWIILPSFVIFFFAGFLMYSSLFAAVGSAIGDDMNEGNSLTFVIMVPIILSMLVLFPTLQDPHGTTAIVSSIFPLTAPVIMPARLAFDPPLWQVLLSVLFVIGGAIAFIWISGKIYRAGILLYGKKLSFKNLVQIMRR